MTRRPAVILALAFVAGICGENVCGPWPLLFAATMVLAALTLALRRGRPWPGMLLVALAFLCGAFAAWDRALIPVDHIHVQLERLKGRAVDVVCRVAVPPEKKTGGLAPQRVFTCDLEQVGGCRLRGKVIVNLYGDGDIFYGDRLHARGKFSTPFDPSPGSKLSYRDYLAGQGIYAVLHVGAAALRERYDGRGPRGFEGAAMAVRLRLQEVFRHCLSPGEAGLMNAMLLGPRQDIPPHVHDIFRRTGTAHIIAISGMNMTLTSAGVVFFLGLCRAPRLPRALLAVAILAFYACMAGNSAPVARAALMAAVFMMSFVIERETDAVNTLALAALLLLAADPAQLRDVGFQLSFACVAALIFLTPLVLAPFEGASWKENKLAWILAESAGVTFAAFIGSAGILAYDFGYITPVGLAVNLPVIPLMALVTALGAVVAFTGALAPFLAMPFALALKVVLNISIGILAMAARVPVIPCAGIAVWGVAVYYVILVSVTTYFHMSAGKDKASMPRPPLIH